MTIHVCLKKMTIGLSLKMVHTSSKHTWNLGSVFTAANEEEPDAEVKAQGMRRLRGKLAVFFSQKSFKNMLFFLTPSLIILSLTLITLPQMIIHQWWHHPGQSQFLTIMIILMLICTQMIVMLMVVATVYTACYFPINIVWVRQRYLNYQWSVHVLFVVVAKSTLVLSYTKTFQ